jgi:hypothetical protein
MPRRRADKVDANQAQIVKDLRALGISVLTGHDDILCGYAGRTYMYEIKTGPRAEIKPSQIEMLDTWKGHYKIVWTLQMILADIGYAP